VLSPPRVALVTFYGGQPVWRWAARRLVEQAMASSWFTTVTAYCPRDLGRIDPEFVSRNRGILNGFTRGFGYWIWKPLILRHEILRLSSEVDAVLYLDAGFELNPLGDALRLRDYVDFADADHGRFAMTLNGHAEEQYSKADTLNALSLCRSMRTSPQVQATPLFMSTGESTSFLNCWLDLAERDNHRYLDDTPSEAPNSAAFLAHRHDQSIFSGLMKSLGGATIPDETYWAPDWASAGAAFPLWAARNRSGISIRDSRPLIQSLRSGIRASSLVVDRLVQVPAFFNRTS
jgi:hypothetical protein